MEVESWSSLVNVEIFPLIQTDESLNKSYYIIDHFDSIATENSEELDIDLCEEIPLQ